jgi:signal transduction histidine kinase
MENYHRTGIGKIIGIGREVKGLKKDGSVFPFKLSISEIFLRDRRIYTGIIHDLTAQKKAQEELRHLNQELETRVEQRTLELKKATEKIRKALEKEKELSELKSRFVSMASHEFRTPLSTILSSVALMSRYVHANEPSKLEKHLNRIHSSVNHLKNILDDFLSLSKLEEGKIGVNPEKFDVAALARNVRDNMQLVTKPGQTIEYAEAGETIWVTLDKMAVENVMINLLSNAIKYSPENKKILLSTRWQNGNIHLMVKDEGIGIPAAEQNHLFERFFRAKNALNIQGTGLGLNIVKRYVELMEGEIGFESEENVGTTVYVKLPESIIKQPQV